MKIPKKLKAWRKRQGVSQEKGAAFFGVSVYTYAAWERGKRTPAGENLENVERALAGVAA